MPLDRLLIYAAKLTWRHRSWWLLGLAVTGGGAAFGLLSRGLTSYTGGRSSLTGSDLQAVLESLLRPEPLVIGLIVLFVLVLAIWLVGAIAEGGLIVAVSGHGNDEAIGLVELLQRGIGLLGRYIAIDTLLFLPLFLLALALLAVGFAGLLAMVLVATQATAQLRDLLAVVGVSTLVGVPVMLAMLFVGLVVMLLRTLAFRAVALEQLNAAESIRRAWQLLRRRSLPVVVLALVLAALRSLVGAPLRIATFILAGMGLSQFVLSLEGSGPQTDVSLLVTVGGLVLSLVSWCVSGIMSVYGSASWTLAYERWIRELADEP
jgi:hypothetical protein